MRMLLLLLLLAVPGWGVESTETYKPVSFINTGLNMYYCIPSTHTCVYCENQEATWDWIVLENKDGEKIYFHTRCIHGFAKKAIEIIKWWEKTGGSK